MRPAHPDAARPGHVYMNSFDTPTHNPLKSFRKDIRLLPTQTCLSPPCIAAVLRSQTGCCAGGDKPAAWAAAMRPAPGWALKHLCLYPSAHLQGFRLCLPVTRYQFGVAVRLNLHPVAHLRGLLWPAVAHLQRRQGRRPGRGLCAQVMRPCGLIGSMSSSSTSTQARDPDAARGRMLSLVVSPVRRHQRGVALVSARSATTWPARWPERTKRHDTKETGIAEGLPQAETMGRAHNATSNGLPMSPMR